MSKKFVITALLSAVLSTMALLTGLSCSRQAHVLWQRRFAVGSADFGSSVATDGRDMIVGTTHRDTLTVRQHTGWQFLRYDRKGSLLWQHTYDRGGFDVLADVTVSADHDIVGVGWTNMPLGSYPSRLLLARFSAQGDVKWQREYQFARSTRGVAVRLDTIGRTWVSGSVTGASDGNSHMFVARFDSLGNVLDSVAFDFGGNETGENLLLVPSRFHTPSGIFVAGKRAPQPGKPDTLTTRDVVVVSLDQNLQEKWRWVYNSGGDDELAGLAWQDCVCLAVTSRGDSGVVTHLVEHSAEGCYPSIEQDTRYSGVPKASCAALVRDRSGALLGVGAYGPDGQRRCLGWRYFRGKFTDFLSGGMYASGANDRASDLALDADGNVIVTGVSAKSEKDVGILTMKLALPRYKPPPGIWLPNMYR